MDIATATPAAQDEKQSLQALKEKLPAGNNSNLVFARALDSHLGNFDPSLDALARDLGKSASFLKQTRYLLRLSTEAQQNLEGFDLTYTDLQALSSLPTGALKDQLCRELKEGKVQPGTLTKRARELAPPSQDEKNEMNASNNANERTERQGHAEVLAPNRPTNEMNASNAEKNKMNAPNEGYPLIRDTIDELVKLMTFWKQQINLGQIVERWLIKFRQKGWPWTALTVIYFALAVFGAIHFSAALTQRSPWWPTWRISRQGLGAGAPAAGSETLAAPHLTGLLWKSGHRMELHWDPVGTHNSYRVYWHAPNNGFIQRMPPDVKTPGAIISISQSLGKGMLSVTTIGPNDAESGHSDSVDFVPEPVNTVDSVEPLALEGTPLPVIASPASPATANAGHANNLHKENQLPHSAPSAPISAVPVANPQQVPHAQSSFLGSFAKKLVGSADGVVSSMVPIAPLAQGINATKNAALQASAEGGNPSSTPRTPSSALPVVPVPTGLQVVKMLSPSQAQISWTSLGSNYTYNLYSSRSQDMASAHKENAQPTAKTVVSWWSDFGPGTYWLAVTAVDPSGNESQFYNSVQVTVQ